MKHRFTVLVPLTSVAALAVAATAVGGSRQTAVAGEVTVLGPYGGAGRASFAAVLDGFEPTRTLAEALTKANAFRLDLSEQQPAAFRTRLGELVREFVQRPAHLDRVTGQLEGAASNAFDLR